MEIGLYFDNNENISSTSYISYTYNNQKLLIEEISTANQNERKTVYNYDSQQNLERKTIYIKNNGNWD